MAIPCFTGTFARTIDDKFRLQIPKEVQRVVELVQGKDNRTVFLVLGREPYSVDLYTEVGFQALGRRVALELPKSDEARRFSRDFFPQAHQVTADGQWRLILPEPLRTRARLKGEVRLLGVWDRVMIHTPESLERADQGQLREEGWPDWSQFLPSSLLDAGAGVADGVPQRVEAGG